MKINNKSWRQQHKLGNTIMTIKQIAQVLRERGIECDVITDNSGDEAIINIWKWKDVQKIADEFHLDIFEYRLCDGIWYSEGIRTEPYNEEEEYEGRCSLYDTSCIDSLAGWCEDEINDADGDEEEIARIKDLYNRIAKALATMSDDQFIAEYGGGFEIYDKYSTSTRTKFGDLYCIGLWSAVEQSI